MPLFKHAPHPHIAARARTPPAQARPRGRVAAPNDRLAVAITRSVGTMWCAYAFAALALVSLPASIATGNPVVIVGWVAQTFLQLVLLSVILLGDRLSTAAADARDERTFLDAEAILHTALAVQDHLAAQDNALTKILAELPANTDLPSGLHTRLDSQARKPPNTTSAPADTQNGGGPP